LTTHNQGIRDANKEEFGATPSFERESLGHIEKREGRVKMLFCKELGKES